MADTLQIIAEYACRRSPRAAEAGKAIAELPVHLVFDSIGMLDFLSFLEQSFQIRIQDADVLPENFETFAAVARLVESKKTA
ncbi:MAG: hypothetical protein ACE15D_03170 [Candidatus Eisenbacteria bacterium]